MLGVGWLLAGAAWLCSTCLSGHPLASPAEAEVNDYKGKCGRPCRLRLGTGAPLLLLCHLGEVGHRSGPDSRMGAVGVGGSGCSFSEDNYGVKGQEARVGPSIIRLDLIQR